MSNGISKKRLREFGGLIGIGFPVLIGWLIPTVTGHTFKVWTLWVGLPFILIGATSPRLLLYPYKTWMGTGEILGWINSRIILGLIFLLVLQPIALVMRVFGYDPLNKKLEGKKSYRENKGGHKTDLTRIF